MHIKQAEGPFRHQHGFVGKVFQYGTFALATFATDHAVLRQQLAWQSKGQGVPGMLRRADDRRP
jgi:hypothetical protein